MTTVVSNARERQLYRRTLGVTIIGYSYMPLGLAGVVLSLLGLLWLFGISLPSPPPASASFDRHFGHWVGTKFSLIVIASIFCGLIGALATSFLMIATGWGLTRRRKWSRLTGMILAILVGPYATLDLYLWEHWVASGTVFAITMGVLIVLFLHPYEFMTEKVQGRLA